MADYEVRYVIDVTDAASPAEAIKRAQQAAAQSYADDWQVRRIDEDGEYVCFVETCATVISDIVDDANYCAEHWSRYRPARTRS